MGIEFGATRIKAVLIDENHNPIAAGDHEWENRLENGVWTYRLEEIWEGLQDSYDKLAEDVERHLSDPADPPGSHRIFRNDARIYGI